MTDTETEPGFVEVRENAARDAAKEMTVNGGVKIMNYAQLVDLSKYMSTAGWAVRKELRNNIGACMMIVEQADQWGFSRWQLARACYVVNDILCFESQVIHAIVEKFAPLKERLRVRYEGEGGKRKAIITGWIRGEASPLEYESPEIGNISPKNSPLWKTDPDQQFFYLASQRWCKRYCPDVLLGIHDIDSMVSPSIAPGDVPHIGFNNAKDITPGQAVRERLANAGGDQGFVGEASIATIDAALDQAQATQEVPEA